ncbi:MAG TPA: hypothetical protein VKV35_07010 [Streptosporangiaceae bacterium]|nr:hypothetical protein [Streptosporangiaceae bacterium]
MRSGTGYSDHRGAAPRDRAARGAGGPRSRDAAAGYRSGPAGGPRGAAPPGPTLPWSAELAGRIEEHVIASDLLRGNPLGDPHRRPLLVYLPPGYDDEPGRAYPSVYVRPASPRATTARWTCRSTRRPACSGPRCGSGGWTGIPCGWRPPAGALRGLRGIWIDAGTRDEFRLDLGAAAFRAALRDAGVPDEVIRFELFDAGHMGIEYRYPVSLAWLCRRVAGPAP